MLKWLKRIFNMENTTTATENASAAQISAAQQIPQTRTPLVRKFEIAVYDITLNEASGKEEYRPIAYSQPVIIEATSPADLKSKLGIYRQCGQFAKVIREVDPPPQTKNVALQQQPTSVQREAAPIVQPTPTATTGQIEVPRPEVCQKQKPRIYRLGDIEIKDDNGKIYQKQWMKLTDNEAANFRVINDKNNSITSLAGKHIEMKKWVLVENVDDDETSSLEENMQ